MTFFVDLACDRETGEYRMAEIIPGLKLGRYRVRPVGGGRHIAWAGWKPDPGKPNRWFTGFSLVRLGNGWCDARTVGNATGFRTADEALSQALPEEFEVRKEETLIFCIADSGRDNSGGLRLAIERI